MVKPAVLRQKTVGARVTEQEYAKLQAAAGNRNLSEWARAVLLEAAEGPKPTPSDEALMAEVLALRTLFVNAIFKLSHGGAISEADMRQLIERSDLNKRKKALERLYP